MNPAPRAESEAFLDAITAINLRRIRGLLLVGAPLTSAVLVINLSLVGWRQVTTVGVWDLALTLGLLVAVTVIRRRKRQGRAVRVFVVAFVALWLGGMNAYYFSALAAGTHNASYAIGVSSCAVFFLLRPALSFSLLGLNHAYYCTQLLLAAGLTSRKVAAPLIDGTVCVLVAGAGSWFLFQAARENFRKERIIEERNRALAASNAELREVMAIAAHDLRSPLLDVRNLLTLGRREPGAQQGPLAHVLTLATDACSGLVQLVSRLVEAHEVEEAATTLTLAPVDLGAACRAAAERLKATAAAKSQRIAVTLPPPPALASTDATRLAQVIDNLLGNALKFSPRDTTIDLVLAAREGGWRLEVHDEGPGVADEERAGLFRKFQRGSARPTGGESSTGLGLFIVKSLTEAMGGHVSHAPREPRGSVFCVELPAVKDRNEPAVADHL